MSSPFPGVKPEPPPETTTAASDPAGLAHPPLGFRWVRASARRAASDAAVSRRNCAHFVAATRRARAAAVAAAADETCDFILMNRGGAAPVTEADPLLLPKWRFEPGKNADEAAFVLRALGLVPDANNAACDGRKHWTWIPPPGPASNGARDGEEALDDDPGPVAFDVASLDEALALEREGPDAERERIWLSSATLVILPPVLISHWLEQIQFALAGDEEEAGFLRRGDAPPRVCASPARATRRRAPAARTTRRS